MSKENKSNELNDNQLKNASGGDLEGTFTISFNAIGCMYTPDSISNLESGSSFSTNGNTFTYHHKGSRHNHSLCVFPDAYHNGSPSWSPSSGKVTSNMTITVSYENNII